MASPIQSEVPVPDQQALIKSLESEVQSLKEQIIRVDDYWTRRYAALCNEYIATRGKYRRLGRDVIRGTLEGIADSQIF
jgi:hypothetical protein